MCGRPRSRRCSCPLVWSRVAPVSSGGAGWGRGQRRVARKTSSDRVPLASRSRSSRATCWTRARSDHRSKGCIPPTTWSIRWAPGPASRSGTATERTTLRRPPADEVAGRSLRAGPLLRLKAEMKVPGRAWLQFEVEPEGGGSRITQTAVFDPSGLAGLGYWYSLYPVHWLIFRGMLGGIVRAGVAGPPAAGVVWPVKPPQLSS